MEKDLLDSVRGNVRTLREIWTLKVNDTNSFISNRERSQTRKTLSLPSGDDSNLGVKTAENDFLLKNCQILTRKYSPPAVVFDEDEDQTMINEINSGNQRWQNARRLILNSLLFNRKRRASDSLLPLLKKKHEHRTRADSVESHLTPIQCLVDYVCLEETNESESSAPNRMKRSRSLMIDCNRRNQLDDSILQYEQVLRHLKNYEQFMTDYYLRSQAVTESTATNTRRKSFDQQLSEPIREIPSKEASRKSSQTQSLSRQGGRTFSQFLSEDLGFSNELNREEIVSQQSQTHTEFISEQEMSKGTTTMTNDPSDLDEQKRKESTVATDHSSPISANTPVHVIVVNSLEITESSQLSAKRKTLIETLFENKKGAFNPDEIELHTTRLPQGMTAIYYASLKKYLSNTENVLYTTPMHKICRHGFKQDLRILCLTNERLYNFSAKKASMKEVNLLTDISGISCTPFKDGIVCIHTKADDWDRGDWIIRLDRPCEFITQLFSALARGDNNDAFLRIEKKFHNRRAQHELMDLTDCSIEARPAENYRLEIPDARTLIIHTP